MYGKLLSLFTSFIGCLTLKQAIRRQPLEITTNPTKKANKIVCNIIFGSVVIVALLMLVSLLTYHPDDSAWSKTMATSQVSNWLGTRGAYFSDILFSTIGRAAWFAPVLLIAYGYRLVYQEAYKNLDIETIIIRVVGVALVLLSLASLFNVYNPNGNLIEHGGAIGQFIATLLSHSVGWLENIFPESFISITVSKVVLFFLLFITAIMASGCGPLVWTETIGAILIKAFQMLVGLFKQSNEKDNTGDLANIEHLMTKESHTEEKSDEGQPKTSLFSKFIKHKQHTQDLEPALNENHDDIQKEHIPAHSLKAEPTFGAVHSYTSEENTASTITPKFEPQMDEKGEPKLPSIFKRPTIKSAPQDDENSTPEDARVKNLSDWVNNDEPLEIPASMFAKTTSAELEPSAQTPIFNIPTEKHEPIIPSQTFNEPEIAPSSHTGQSMFSQTNSFADHKATETIRTTNIHDDEQDFNAFLEELEKYHPPKFSDEPTFATIEEPTHNTETFIMESFPEVEMITESTEKEIDLPQVTEFFEEPDHTKLTIEPAIEEISVPTWEPFEPTPSPVQAEPELIIEPEPQIEAPKPIQEPKQNIVMPTPRLPEPMSEGKKAELLKQFPMAGQLPPLNLLGDPPPSYNQYDVDELNDMAQLIEEQLKNFSIKVQVANIEPGPVVTRFELDLAPGVKVAQINNLEKDIARGLSVTSVRVVDIIPGTSYVGLEIPNRKREIVYFKTGLESKEYQDAKDPLTLILGKSISGEPVLANLAKMPHVLVAGTTGSGKSVGVNTMLLSMLFKARPEELRLILIDPKMLELSVYNDIPHLLIPVITDMKESANALRWCVAEMERRYMLMSQLKVRNIAGFNQKVQEAMDAGQPIIDPLWRRSEHVSDTENPPLLEKLPFIVVVIDEFADMMMLVGKKCEELIARLAQKARASGIHLILATQRPSVDVITGLIKANIPTRIAFQVSSKIDSRTIIDQQGAETLLGHGDMLYAPSGVNVPIRVHGSFVDDHEVNKVAEFLKLTGEPDYIEDILQEPTEAIPGLSPEASGVPASPSDEQDPLFDEAVKIVVESRRASISYIQRKLRVGYQRAARLMEEMEELRIVTPPQSNGNREVLLAADNDDY